MVIRRARPADKRGVREAVRTIWGGGDRVPALFDDWVRGRTGPFFVAEANGRIVGMGKLTALSPREAWLEGGRVAPRYRRRGISTALIAHRLAYARERGFTLARFSTASDNTPIHRAARRFGFRRVRAFERFEAPPTREGARPARATPRDAARVRRLVGPYVQHVPGWEWRTLTARDIERAISRGRAFLDGSAAAIVGSTDDRELHVVAIGGAAGPVRVLLERLRREAASRRATEVGVYIAEPRLRRAAIAAGYTRPWSGAAYLYERRLP